MSSNSHKCRLTHTHDAVNRVLFHSSSLSAHLQRLYQNIVKRHPKLATVNLSHNQISDNDIRILVKALQHCTYDDSNSDAPNSPLSSNVRCLRLSHNFIGPKGCKDLANLLQCNSSKIEGLGLAANQHIGNEGVIALSLALAPSNHHNNGNSSSGGGGGGGGGSNQSERVPSSSLRSLTLNQCNISNKGIKALALHLQQNKSLEYLYLGMNRIGENEEQQEEDRHDHEHSYYGDSGAVALGEMLKVNTKLKILSLYHNNIGNDGAIALASSLEGGNNNTLRSLVLNHNQIHDEGAIALGQMLKVNRGLKELSLTSNAFGPLGQNALLEGVRHNLSLVALDVVKDATKSPLQQQINHYMFLNDVGHRHILREQDHQEEGKAVPTGLWTFVLAKFANHPFLTLEQSAGILYHYIQSKPELFM